jgi:hypothetical protein
VVVLYIPLDLKTLGNMGKIKGSRVQLVYLVLVKIGTLNQPFLEAVKGKYKECLDQLLLLVSLDIVANTLILSIPR